MEKLLKLKDFMLELMHDIWKIMQLQLQTRIEQDQQEKNFIQKIPFVLAN